MSTADSTYPVRVDASLDRPLSRWLWLVKWLLIVPHVVVLVFLWMAFAVLSVVAFFAILITGRYPRAIFDFNVGVLRWTWRVQYYSYSALGTDRYPPFTLQDVPDYPAHLEVDYPQRLSRGLVLVKWWLLVLPHYLIVGVFVGGGIWLAGQADSNGAAWAAGGLVGLLVLIAAVVLLFTGRYPQPLYDFVLGMDRWVIRVGAYAGLMTDRYPPFRLDLGGPDPSSTPVPAGPVPPAGTATKPVSQGTPSAPTPSRSHRWTAGRIVAATAGAMLLLMSTGLLVGGGGLLWADQTQRDGGYLSTPPTSLSTNGYAVITDDIQLDTVGYQWAFDEVLGTARLQVIPSDATGDLFVGIAPSADIGRYLNGVAHSRFTGMGSSNGLAEMGPAMMTESPGGPPASPPGEMEIWVAQSSGPGTRTVEWVPADGAWTVVVMRADGVSGLAAQARMGVTAPGLPWFAAGLLGLGTILLIIGGLLIAFAVHRSTRPPPRQNSAPPTAPWPAAPSQATGLGDDALVTAAGPRG